MQKVTPCAAMSCARYCVSFSPPGAASTSLPPQARGLKSSCKMHHFLRTLPESAYTMLNRQQHWRGMFRRTCTDGSKLMGIFCRNTSSGPSFKRLRHAQQM